jgi:integrase/recombinase XerD
MMTPDFVTHLTAFFAQYLPAERNVSGHTTAAYRDAFKLLLRFALSRHHCAAKDLSFEDLSPDVILLFLADLESTRGNSVRTRNARLAAIHSFFRFVLAREPALAALCQRVLSIPTKKTVHPVLGYLTEDQLSHLLAQVDRTTRSGERDYLLIALLYDTGARIQELLEMTPGDFRFDPPPCVRLHGKGRRDRLCPLLPQTARVVQRFLRSHGRTETDAAPLLQNGHHALLTRHGARYLLAKYVARARRSMPALQRLAISPHTLRHTKAMHLLQAGVPLVMIKDFLGHVDVTSTEIYVQADLSMKRHALESAGTPCRSSHPARRIPTDVLAWLDAL